MDHQLFLAINGLVGKWPWFDKLGAFLGGDYFLYLVAVIIVLLWLKKNFRQRVYLALASGLVGYGLAGIIKHLVTRPRPFEVLKVHQLIVDNERGVSFPSGHATVYFAFAFAFWGTEYFWPFLTAAVIGSVGRVLVGVHYPADVLVGAIVGALTVWGLRRLFKKHILR
jgi:undecaprenyl-diphosphatase